MGLCNTADIVIGTSIIALSGAAVAYYYYTGTPSSDAGGHNVNELALLLPDAPGWTNVNVTYMDGDYEFVQTCQIELVENESGAVVFGEGVSSNEVLDEALPASVVPHECSGSVSTNADGYQVQEWHTTTGKKLFEAMLKLGKLYIYASAHDPDLSNVHLAVSSL